MLAESKRTRHNVVFHYVLECRCRGLSAAETREIVRSATANMSRDMTPDIDGAIATVFSATPRRRAASTPAWPHPDDGLMARVWEEATSDGAPLTREQWVACSPKPVPRDPNDALKQLFRPGELVWCGERKDSVRRLRPLEFWIDALPWPPELVAPSTFKTKDGAKKADGDESKTGRTKSNVGEWRYTVVEFDDVETTTEQFARIWAIRQQTGSHLVAVLFSGGKSIHSWWCAGDEEERSELLSLAAQLGADTHTFTGEQPVRMPAGRRLCNQNGKEYYARQEVYYWNPPPLAG